jgi:RNA polymerase-binding transcription factor
MIDTTIRNADLRHILSTRRREMQDDVHRRIRDVSTGQPAEVRDAVEHSDADFYEEMELALLQMRSEMLIRVDEALLRLDAGAYGSCSECAGEIAQPRLRALPFAVRCQACEEKHEQALEHTRHAAQLYGDFSLVPEMAGL